MRKAEDTPTKFYVGNDTNLPLSGVLEPIYDETTLAPGEHRNFFAWPASDEELEIRLRDSSDGRVEITLYAEHDGIFHPDDAQSEQLKKTIGTSILETVYGRSSMDRQDRRTLRISNRMTQPSKLWIEPFCTEVALPPNHEISFDAQFLRGLPKQEPSTEEYALVVWRKDETLWLTVWVGDLDDQVRYGETVAVPIRTGASY